MSERRDEASPWTTTETWTWTTEADLKSRIENERKRIDALAARVAEIERQLRDLWGWQHDETTATVSTDSTISDLAARVTRLEGAPEDERVPLLDRIKGLEKRVLSLELDWAYDCPMPAPQPVSDAYTLDKSRLQRVCEALGVNLDDDGYTIMDWDDMASGLPHALAGRDALLWRVVVALAERGRGWRINSDGVGHGAAWTGIRTTKEKTLAAAMLQEAAKALGLDSGE